MDPIDVPKPKGVRDPDRAAGALLLAQVRHMHEADKSLPTKYHSGIFHKAVVTEDDVARYIQAVTKAIHKAHDDASTERARRAAARKRVTEIAAAADQGTSRKRLSSAKRNKGKGSKSKRVRKTGPKS
jgi:hypothetical protein